MIASRTNKERTGILETPLHRFKSPYIALCKPLKTKARRVGGVVTQRIANPGGLPAKSTPCVETTPPTKQERSAKLETGMRQTVEAPANPARPVACAGNARAWAAPRVNGLGRELETRDG